MSDIKKGELAFLPSDITLLKYKTYNSIQLRNIESGSVDKWTRTNRPCHVLVVEPSPRGFKAGMYTEVLYEGEKWMARKQDLYPARVAHNGH